MSLRNINIAKEHKTVNKEDNKLHIFIYVGNIPENFKSADLRYFFKDILEQGAFDCFHYRHRPEKQIISDKCNENTSSLDSSKVEQKTYCCIVRIHKHFLDKIIAKYSGKEWRGKNSKFHGKQTNIKKLNVKESNDFHRQYKSKKEIKIDKHITDQDIYQEDILNMIEMNPPELMPNGNVGTPTKYFHQLIRQCKLPSSVIKSLGLEFPKLNGGTYSKVPMDYGESGKDRGITSFCIHQQNSTQSSTHNVSSTTNNIDFHVKKTSENILIKHASIDKPSTKSKDSSTKSKDSSTNSKDSSIKSKDSSDDVDEKEDEDLGEDHNAEDWDRYEALHDDVDNQGRPKERLFEEDIELKWEKGGSGLVFYTDSFFWNEMKGKDFDEDTVDDWDVDYSIYYEDGAGDKAARDQLQMRIAERRHQGKHDGPMKYSQIRRKEKQFREEKMSKFGDFEKYSKGFGSRILKKQGWKEGEGVGVVSNKGISEPIELEGQSTRIRTGIGYFGDKLDRTVSLKRRAERDVYISTVYDKKDGEEIDAMRYHGKELLKYRPVPVKFHCEKKEIKS